MIEDHATLEGESSMVLDGVAVGVDHLEALVVFLLSAVHTYASWVDKSSRLSPVTIGSVARDAYLASAIASARIDQAAHDRRESAARPSYATVTLEDSDHVTLIHRVRSFGVAMVFEREVPLGLARAFAQKIVATLEHDLPFVGEPKAVVVRNAPSPPPPPEKRASAPPAPSDAAPTVARPLPPESQPPAKAAPVEPSPVPPPVASPVVPPPPPEPAVVQAVGQPRAPERPSGTPDRSRSSPEVQVVAPPPVLPPRPPELASAPSEKTPRPPSMVTPSVAAAAAAKAHQVTPPAPVAAPIPAPPIAAAPAGSPGASAGPTLPGGGPDEDQDPDTGRSSPADRHSHVPDTLARPSPLAETGEAPAHLVPPPREASRSAVRPAVVAPPPLATSAPPSEEPAPSSIAHRARRILSYLSRHSVEPHVVLVRVALRTGLGLEALAFPQSLGSDALVLLETAAEDMLGLDHEGLLSRLKLDHDRGAS